MARLIAQGLSNPQIARHLFVSRHTVETHMKHIFVKLAVSSRSALTGVMVGSSTAAEP